MELVNNDLRVQKPLYRAPGTDAWKEVEWDWALDQIARKVKDTRDRTFKLTSKSKVKEKQPDGTEKEVEKDFVGQPDRRHRPCGQRCLGQRGVLPAPEDDAVLGPGIYRTPGAHLTLRDCSRLWESRSDAVQ